MKLENIEIEGNDPTTREKVLEIIKLLPSKTITGGRGNEQFTAKEWLGGAYIQSRSKGYNLVIFVPNGSKDVCWDGCRLHFNYKSHEYMIISEP